MQSTCKYYFDDNLFCQLHDTEIMGQSYGEIFEWLVSASPDVLRYLVFHNKNITN